MKYEILLTDRAKDDIEALDRHHQALIETHLSRLAESPSFGRPVVSPPYPPSWGMMYEFDGLAESGIRHHFVVFYRFGQDERTIVVLAVGHSALDASV